MIVWNTIFLFQQQSKKKRNQKKTIIKPKLRQFPRFLMILSCFMLFNSSSYSHPLLNILDKVLITQQRTKDIANLVVLSPAIVCQYSALKFKELKLIRFSNSNTKSYSKDNTHSNPTHDFLELDNLTEKITHINCEYDNNRNDKDQLTLSTKSFTELNMAPSTATDFMNGITQANYFPIIFDPGASLAISPFKEDFIGECSAPEHPLFLGGLANGMPIEGIGTVEWTFRAGKQNLAIKTKFYYVPRCKARLISPQRLFNKNEGVIDEFTCLEDNAYL